MKLRISIWSVVVVAVALSSVVLLSSDQAMASNMGFKMNKVIIGTGTNPIGQNRVALPYRNPYQNALDVCNALGLTPLSGRIQQIDAATGVTASHICTQAGPFALTPRVGVRVTNPTAAGGILVGSHASNPPGSVTLRKAGATPIGQNDFPVPYHTTAVTSNDLCTDLSLPNGARVRQLDASTGVTCVVICGTAPVCNVVLGESVLISDLPADIVVPAGHPAHF